MRRLASYGLVGAGGVAIGAVAVSEELAIALVDAFLEILHRHGFAVAIATILVLGTIALVWRLVNTSIQGKNDEIKRLVEIRDRLLEHILNDVPSSGIGNGDD